MRGWRSYFGFCETPEVLIGLTRWVRLRLRSCSVAAVENTAPPSGCSARSWEFGRRLASNTAGSGLGPWYLATSQGPFCWAFQCLLQIAWASLD